MTQPQADLQEQVNNLASRHQPPIEVKQERQLAKLLRMAQFYEDKLPEAPEKQGYLFKSFVTALFYAITIIKSYSILTARLKELAEEPKK